MNIEQKSMATGETGESCHRVTDIPEGGANPRGCDRPRGSLKVGSKVSTPDGPGVIVDFEDSGFFSGGRRYGVKLENNPFSFAPAPAYYWREELERGEA